MADKNENKTTTASEEIIDAETLSVFIEDANDVLGQWEKFCFELKPEDNPEGFKVLMRCAHNLKGSAGLAGFNNLHHRLHVIEDYLLQIKSNFGTPHLKFENVVSTLLNVEHEIRQWVDNLNVDPITERSIDSESIERSLRNLLEKTDNQPSQGKPAPEQFTSKKINLSEPNQPKGETTAKTNSSKTLSKRRDTHRAEETLRVNASKIDHLIQLVGEVSLNQSILTRSLANNTLDSVNSRTAIDLNSKLVQDLQDAALDIRMIPVDGLFQKIERMLRDTATKIAKQIRVERTGEDVTLDKLIVESMVEPLIHLARNSVDHGIESPEDRIKFGKDPIGLIKLTAENTSTGVSLIMEDDGKGIDGERAYKKAVERGLIDRNIELTKNAKLQLIFLPGLSTAEKVTELSGRGVGMDVVAAEVQRLAGKIEIQSEMGRGTRVHISLPTNLSIIDAIVVRTTDGLYAVPNRDIVEIIDLREFASNTVDGKAEEVIDLRGKIIPLAKAKSFLVSAQTNPFTQKINIDNPKAINGFVPQAVIKPLLAPPKEICLLPEPCLIIRHLDDLLGLQFDAVVGQQQIFVRPLLGHLIPVTYFSGTTILADGEPCIILNLSEMARHYFTST